MHIDSVYRWGWDDRLFYLGSRDQSCGKLYCTGGWEYPVTSSKVIYQVTGETCNLATMKAEDNYPADMGMVPTGTKCGHNMVRNLRN